jgi:hypothetical protein
MVCWPSETEELPRVVRPIQRLPSLESPLRIDLTPLCSAHPQGPVTLLGILAGIALAAQDKYALQVPNGLAFSEFKGYTYESIEVGQSKPGFAYG